MDVPEPNIAASAYKHGVSAHDIAHAVRLRIVSIPQGLDRRLLVGPAVDGALLELVTLNATSTDAELVIHAMKIRPKFYRYLR